MLASRRNGTLYVGMTNNLLKRVTEHRSNFVDGFTKRHGIHTLVYFEQTDDVTSALNREKQIKKWNRKWKLRLIEENNPHWRDLFDEII
ncbi:MAG: GIY-YIG nuclease family protein [candidate division Zixibacteria bacterium]|nr:GIY-YIG nuclease family protein [candidate division Zixibacteria bacterium]